MSVRKRSWVTAKGESRESWIITYRDRNGQRCIGGVPRGGARARDDLRAQGRSGSTTRRVIGSLGALLADAQEQGLTAHNAVRDLRRNRQKGKERNAEKRQKGKLKVGVDIPTPDEIRSIIANAQGRWRPLLITAIFTGLRASELRGLRWEDVDFNANKIHVDSEPTASMRLASPSPMPVRERFHLASSSQTH